MSWICRVLGQSRWGFEMTALDANGARAGSFTTDAAGNAQLSEAKSKQYIKHTSIGTAQGTDDAHSWEFQWTAPDADVGPITFYASGNASNGNFNPVDDYIYTEQAESTPPIPVVAGVSLENCRKRSTLYNGCRCRCELHPQGHEYR